ncbi:28S ribosomal mitochondrial-like [Brachionus plicatilis]|uniref:28S ribosomal mitochondrial-like n=1 Tax=Brachionus plicatilis TaxID=10195 RepID=A0A3M7S3K2_BRAPC|nr:28S ribosomal mitochondrial-like [Brachionus plicatilis]
MDLLATKIIHVNNIQELELIENIFLNFRKTQPAMFVRDSMHYSFARNYLDLNQANRLLQILKLKYKYGIFLDSYTANMLMDYFIKNGDHKNAALTAHEIMLQENAENEFTLAVCLLTCFKCLRIGVDDVDEESNIEDSKQTKEKRLVYFLRKEYNDEHFDLKSIPKLCGKTIYFSSSNLKMDDQNLNKNLKLYGLVHFGKYEKAVEFLENSMIKNNEAIYDFVIDDFKKTIDSLIQNEESSQKFSASIEKWNNLSKVLESESEKFVSKANIDSIIQKIENYVNQIGESQTKIDIENQNNLFLKWNKEQESELNEQIRSFAMEQKKQSILQRLENLEKQEEMITFFEKRQEIIDAYYGKGFPTEYPSDIPIEPEESIFKAKYERHFKPWPKYMNRPKSSYGISKSRASKLESLKKIYFANSNQPQ